MQNNQEKNTPEEVNKEFDFNITLLEEFLTQNEFGNKLLVTGLELMFKNYFKNHRYFETQDSTEAVLEAYHFCNFLIANKQLFNNQKIA